MADGSLIFDTKIDTDGFESGVSDIKGSLNRFKNTIRSVGESVNNAFGLQSNKVTDLKSKIEQTEQGIQGLRAELDQIGQATYQSSMFDKMQAEIEKTEQKLYDLLNQREQLENSLIENSLTNSMKELGLPDIDSSGSGTLQASAEWQKLTAQINKTEQSLSGYERKLSEVKADDAKVDTTQTSEYRKKQESLDKLSDKLAAYRQQLKETQNTEKKSTGSGQKVRKSMDRTKKAASGLSKTLGMLKMSILMAFAFRAIQGITTGIGEGLANLAQHNAATNASISQLQTALLQLKNAFATAFSPILSAVVPALVTLINVLVTACNVLGQFFAVLFHGATTFTQSKKAQVDYAASIKKSGGATKQAGKDAKKAAKDAEKALMGFDEINKLNEANKDSGAGGAGGGGGYEGPAIGDMFEEVPINPKILEAVEKFKDAVKELKKELQPTITALKRLWDEGLSKLGTFSWGTLNDFWNNFLKPLGKWILGEKGLPRFFYITNDLLKSIDWVALKNALSGLYIELEKLAEFAWDGLLDFYEKFLKPIAVWTMSEAIPKLVTAITNFVKKINWDAINLALENFWTALAPFATVVGNGLIKFFESMLAIGAEFINLILPNGLNGLADAIKKIDPKVAEAIGYGLGALAASITAIKIKNSLLKKITELASLIKTIPLKTTIALTFAFACVGWAADIWGEIFEANDEGTLEGALQMMWDDIYSGDFHFQFPFNIEFPSFNELVDACDLWIADIMTGIQAGFEAAFFPFTDWWNKVGKNCWEGFLQGLADAIVNVEDWINKNIVTPVVNAFKNLFGIHSPSTVLAEIGRFLIEGLIQGVQSMMETVKTFFTELYESIKSVFKGVKDWFSRKFSDACKAVMEAFGDIGEWFGERYTDIINVFKNISIWFSRKFSDAYNSITGAFSKIGNWFAERYLAITNAFKNVNTWFKTKFSDAITKIKTVFSPITAWFSGVWSNLKKIVSDTWDAILKLFKKGGKIFLGIKDGIAGVFKSIVNTMITGINRVLAVPFEKINGLLNSIRNTTILGFAPFEGLWSQNPLPIPKIPQLATGAVIPPNAPFLAMLGDQRNGTNIEAPLDTIVQAVKTAIGTGRQNNDVNINLILDGKIVGRASVEYVNGVVKSTGINPLII